MFCGCYSGNDSRTPGDGAAGGAVRNGTMQACQYCQKALQGKRGHAAYCSHACRTAAWRQRKNRHKPSRGEATSVTTPSAPFPPGRDTVLPPLSPTHVAPPGTRPAVSTPKFAVFPLREHAAPPRCRNCAQEIPGARQGQLYCCNVCSAYAGGSKSPLVRFGVHSEECPLRGQPWLRA